MGEVVHSTLMPSLLNDQILMLWAGGGGVQVQKYNLKKNSDNAKRLCTSILTALVNLQKWTYKYGKEVGKWLSKPLIGKSSF